MHQLEAAKPRCIKWRSYFISIASLTGRPWPYLIPSFQLLYQFLKNAKHVLSELFIGQG
jgi:hypothetical protein